MPTLGHEHPGRKILCKVPGRLYLSVVHGFPFSLGRDSDAKPELGAEPGLVEMYRAAIAPLARD